MVSTAAESNFELNERRTSSKAKPFLETQLGDPGLLGCICCSSGFRGESSIRETYSFVLV
jgi:hypothetical protein